MFGHYWSTGTPAVLSPGIACVDHSTALDGHPLVAYRWNGEPQLRSENFAWLPAT